MSGNPPHTAEPERQVGDVFRDPDTGILVRVVSLDPYEIDPIFIWAGTLGTP